MALLSPTCFYYSKDVYKVVFKFTGEEVYRWTFNVHDEERSGCSSDQIENPDETH